MADELAITADSATAVANVPSLAELGRRFVAFVETDSKATLNTYKAAIKRLFAYFKCHGIERPTREAVKAYRDSLKASLKPASINLYMTGARLFFRWAAQEGFYADIADHIKGAKLEAGHKKDYFTARQMQTVLDTASGESLEALRDYAILRLMATTGLRCVEITRANIGDIRPAGNDTALYIQGKGRTEKTEYVKLTANVEAAIRSYLTARKETADNAPLFATVSNHSKDSGRLTARSVSRIVKGRFIQAGFNSDRLTAHSLRHTAATLNLLNGAQLEETRQLLRHHSLNTTLIYQHALERTNNQSEQRIDLAIANA